MQHVLQFKNETNQPQSRLELAFRITRSTFLKLRLRRVATSPQPGDTAPAAERGKGNVWGKGLIQLLFDAPLLSGESAIITLDFADEPPVLDHCSFGTPPPEQVPDKIFLPLDQLDFSKIFDGFD